MHIRSSTPNKLHGSTEPEEHKVNCFKKPLTTMKFSLQKIQEIRSQINNILTKCKQSKNQQQSLILNQDHKKRSSIEISNSYLDGRGGTETERAHLYQRLQRESLNVNNNSKQSDRNITNKKYNYHQIMRNNSLNWANDKQINHCSLGYSKSENNTSRNKLKQQQSNQNGRAMILQQLMQDLDYFTLPSNALHIQNDPNQTHLIICCQNYKLYSLNQYSRMTIYIGQHYRPITSMTKIIILNNNKIFYSSSRDGQIIKWTADSMHGIFKYQLSVRIEESPIQLHLDSQGTLYILTSNYLIYSSYRIKLYGNVKCLQFAQNQLLVAVDNQINQIINNKITDIIKLDSIIKTLLYEDQQLYILTNQGTLIIFNDNQNELEFFQEIQFDADWICTINSNQIFRKDNDIIIQSNQRTRKFQMTDTITCILQLSQQLLVADSKKTIKIIKL